MMQQLKSKVIDYFQIENKVKTIKAMKNHQTFQSGLTALILLGVVSWLRIRPLCLIFVTIFSCWFYTNHCKLRIQISPELENHLNALQQRVVEFRQTKPAVFCALASGCLGVLAIVGHLVSGSVVVLSGLILAAILSTKYNFKIFKIEPKDFDWTEKLPLECELDDDFIPEENETNMFVLERASDLSSLTSPTEDGENDDDKSDEVPSELLIPDSIPEINENSTDDDQDDLLPIVSVSKSESHIKTNNPATDALVKYSKSNSTMKFKKGYFKRDSSLSTTSSSSEESLSKGLQFPDHTSVDGPTSSRDSAVVISRDNEYNPVESGDLVALAVRTQTQALLANSSRLIPTIMSGLVQGVLGVKAGPIPEPSNKRNVTALESSDESDFEILENEDFQAIN